MTRFRSLDDLDVSGKRVLLRADFNVPMKDGKVTDMTRIERGAASIGELAKRGAKVVVLSHFGRPDGKPVPSMSLKPIAAALSQALGGQPVAFAEDCIGPAARAVVGRLPPGGVALLENLRFHPEEEKNDPGFAKALAAEGDLYVNDAFSTAHRAHASTEGIAHLLPAAAGRLMQEELEHLTRALAAEGDLYVNDAFSTAHRAHASTEGIAHLLPTAAGRLMQAELEHLTRALTEPKRPLMAIVGGAKVSTKLELLGNLLSKVDLLVIGGGMANTFLHARGIAIGKSLAERDMADQARAILRQAAERKSEVVLPVDAVVADELRPGVATSTIAIAKVPAESRILDIGPATVADLTRRLAGCRSLVWNGPLGAFETPPFDAGTIAVARAAAELTAAGKLLSVAGGGDTVAALAAAGVTGQFSYVSTAGGAFLEWLEGKTLPGVAALMS
jgi:phosphoglycerate kinase